jgi:hypothetical protein
MSREQTIIIETQYFPSIYTMALLNHHGTALIEGHENYSKQTYRNRCLILGANKVQALSIPVLKPGGKIPITEATFNPAGSWLKDHRRGIISAYSNTPYFEHYESAILGALEPATDKLFEHNSTILSVCLELLNLKLAIATTPDYHKNYEFCDYIDLRNRIHPKIPLPEGLGIKDIPYIQAFGSVFVPGLSILDLLFNEGPNSLSVLDEMV